MCSRVLSTKGKKIWCDQMSGGFVIVPLLFVSNRSNACQATSLPSEGIIHNIPPGSVCELVQVFLKQHRGYTK